MKTNRYFIVFLPPERNQSKRVLGLSCERRLLLPPQGQRPVLGDPGWGKSHLANVLPGYIYSGSAVLPGCGSVAICENAFLEIYMAGLKPGHFLLGELLRGLNRLRKKVQITGEDDEANVTGAEAHTHFATFTARDPPTGWVPRPCPCYKAASD